MAMPPRLLLGAIAVGIVTATASLAFALFAEAERASAVGGALASGGTLIVAAAALYVSHQSIERAEEQIKESRNALELSYNPVVIPIHDVGGRPTTSGALSKHPPAEERYALNSPGRPHYAFIRDSDGTCSLYIQNVGTGPALGICAQLHSPDGLFAESLSHSALVAGSLTQLSLRLNEHPGDNNCPRNMGDYVLRLNFRDVFGRPRVVRACFRTAGTGAWIIDTDTSVLPTQPGCNALT